MAAAINGLRMGEMTSPPWIPKNQNSCEITTMAMIPAGLWKIASSGA